MTVFDKNLIDKKLSEVVIEYTIIMGLSNATATRLINCLLNLERYNLAPYETFRDYINDSVISRKKTLSRVPNFGKNSMSMLEEIVEYFVDPEPVDVISVRDELKTIKIIKRLGLFEDFLDKSLAKISRIYPSLYEYCQSDFDRANRLVKTRTIGAPLAEKFRDYVRNLINNDEFLASLNENPLSTGRIEDFSDDVVYKEATRPMTTVDKQLQREREEVVKNLKDRFEDCFSPLCELISSGKVSITAGTGSLIRRLLDTQHGMMCFQSFKGKTLQEIGDNLSPPVSRERVRQIIAKYKKPGWILDNSSQDYLLNQVVEMVVDNQLPSNEFLARLQPQFFSKVRGVGILGAQKRKTHNRPFNTKERAELAKLLNLDYMHESYSSAVWNIHKIERDLKELAAELGTPHLMPKQMDMVKAGRQDLRGAIGRYGGQRKVAELVGLIPQGQLTAEDGSRTYWTTERIREFLHDVAKKTGRPGMMPSQEEVRRYAPNSGGIISTLTGLYTKDKSKHKTWLKLALENDLKFDRSYTKKTLDLSYIKEFVKSLEGRIGAMTPSEVFVLFQQAGVTTNRNNKALFDNLISAIQSGNFPADEVSKWADGADSELVDALLDPANRNTKEAFQAVGRDPEDHRQSSASEDERLDEETSRERIDEDLPAPNAVDTLKALGASSRVLGKFASDSEAVEFFVAKATGKLWKRCFEAEEMAIAEAMEYSSDNVYEKRARNSFLEEYKASKQLPIPAGYSFKKDDGSLAYPNLMQRLIAHRVYEKRRVLNLSGTGTGKTLSAVLASRVIGAHVTVIACPNNTIDGWVREITETFPDSNVCVQKLDNRSVRNEAHNYFILNHEYFQNRHEGEVKRFINANAIDFVVIDEIHRAKQRDEQFESQRRRLLTGLITDLPDDRPKPRVLGLSATPVINNLYEARSLIELVTSEEHPDIGTTTNLENCMRVYQKFVTLGFRKTSDYRTDRLPTIHRIDATDYLVDLLNLGSRPHPQQVEAVLIRAKWPVISKQIRKKTVIFIDYVSGIVDFLRNEIVKSGFNVVVFTGSEKYATDMRYKNGVDQFIQDDRVDVLLASIKTVATGVDGLQKVCNNVIFANLPWTSTEYEQAIGRFDRQGSNFDTLDIHIPKTFAKLSSGDEWSWCESKLERLRTKKDVANAAVDGEIPDDQNQLAPSKATSYWMGWLQRLSRDGLSEFSRGELKVPLDDSDPVVVATRYASYGDFAKLNARWNRAKSSTTHDRLQENQEEWYHYHTEFAEKEKSWEIIPREEIITELPRVVAPGGVIIDYGCGQAGIKTAISDSYKVISLDHVAIDNDVIECDMADSPVADSSVDAAIFSLSLMGYNIKDYIDDAYRTLRIGGQLFVYHPAKGNDREKFVKGLSENGFEIIKEGRCTSGTMFERSSRALN